MEYKELKEIASINLGLTHSPKYSETGIPFLSVKDITAGTIDFNNCHYISEEEYEKLPKGAKPSSGDILFCRVGTIGKPIILHDEIEKFGIFVSLGYLRIIDESFMPEFIKLWMNSNHFLNQVKKNVSGASLVNLNTGWLSKFNVPIYSLTSQKKIVNELENINDAIKNRKEALELLDKLINDKFLEAFHEELKAGNTYDLKELCEIVTDGTHSTPEYSETGVIFLSSKDVTSKKIDWDHVKYIPEHLHEELKKRVSPRKNDILLAKNGTTGIGAIVDRDCIFDIYVSLALIRVKNTVNPKFMLYQINSQYCKLQFNKSLKGVGVPNLHLDKIRTTKVINPDIEKQNKFVEFAEMVEKQKELINQEIIQLNNLLNKKSDEYFN